MEQLSDWAGSQLPRLTDGVLADILKQIEFYQGGEVVPAEDLRRSVEQNMRSMVAALRDPAERRDMSVVEQTGRLRARQGVPLPELLRAYRIGSMALWDLLSERARTSQDPTAIDTLLSAANLVWRLTDESATALTEAYRATTAELLEGQRQRRSALIEALLTGQPGLDAAPWEVPKLLGLRSDAGQVVIAAETLGPDEPSLPGIERRLAERGIASAWQLTSVAQRGLVSLRPGQLDEVIALVQESALARTGVSPVFHTWREAPRALRLACAALHQLPEGRAGANALGSSLLAGLVAHDRGEGRRVAREVLGAVLDLPDGERAVLLETLQAWLDHDGSAERAAERLYCHPNTVRYRLRRLQELTGRSLTQPRGVADLVVALEAVRGDHVG
ncbi:PucR family transcriptional regulator [Streptomyces sp. NPDC056390]|uniref:PucR family transcriptional regulator n=1 Tax=Streptomyces sp. NPDC056390 TaxID=3345806 RepID=UPI0035D95B89